MDQQILIKLQKFIPDHSLPLIQESLQDFLDLHISIKRERKTKWGDYKYNPQTKQHFISINENLNPYSFLLTFLHELAHCKTRVFHGKVKSHGAEWKYEYRNLVYPFIDNSIFPSPLNEILKSHMFVPKAAITTDLNLYRELRKFDLQEKQLTISDLPDRAIFRVEQGEAFVKVGRRRTRFDCLRLKDKRKFIFSPLVPVFPYENVPKDK